MKLSKKNVISDTCGLNKRFLCFVFILLFLIVSFPPESNANDYTGDISHNCRIDLEDVILALQVLTGTPPGLSVYGDADINGDDAIGLAEAIYGLQVVAFDLPQSLDCYSWNETAVRKVLQTFAYGGHPTDEQVSLWAQMDARIAIDEIFHFDVDHQKLSPSDFDELNVYTNGSLESLGDFLSSDNPNNYTLTYRRDNFDKRSWGGPRYNWLMAIRAKGMNTFLHRIGFWETNYHMSVNQDVGIYPFPIIRHYDNITAALSSSVLYQDVLATGALNAATAYQYGHNHNVFVDDTFRGNDDFAREFHQLYFGILGEYDHEYHESVSIENTARALTGIRANYHPSEEGGPDVEIYFSADVHHSAPLEILHTSIPGPTAREKIQTLADTAISHEESLDNLPIIIVAGLADDNLTPEKISAIRAMWNGLPDKDILEFLKLYAISELFHSKDRIKYHSSFDRHLFLHNQMLLSNWELYEEFQNVRYLLSEDEVTPFYPTHNVFGHQTGSEAFNSPALFKHNYNTSTDGYWYYEQVDKSGIDYRKEWGDIIPRSHDNTYRTKDVAMWLWQRFVADGLKNYGLLEQAHLYALLSTGHDLGYILHDLLPGSPHPDTVYTTADLEETQSEIHTVIQAQGELSLNLDDEDPDLRKTANRYIQRTIAFIAATPYTFLEEGR